MSECFYNSKRRQFAPFYKGADGAPKVGSAGLVAVASV